MTLTWLRVSCLAILACSLIANPSHSAAPTSGTKACPAPLSEWSSFERRVWRKICDTEDGGSVSVGKTAILPDGYEFDLSHLQVGTSAVPSACLDHDGAEKTIGRSFLRSILLDKKMTAFLKDRGGLRLSGFSFQDGLGLNRLDSPISVQLDNALLCGHLELADAVFRRDVRFDNVLVVNRDENGHLHLGRVNLRDSAFETLRISNTMAGVVDASWVSVRKELSLDSSKFGHILLRNASLGSELSAENTSQLSAYWQAYEGPDERSAYGDRVDLTFSRIAGIVDFDIVRIEGVLKFVRSELGGITGKCAAIASFDGTRATVSGDVLFRFATLGEKVNSFEDTCVFNSVPKNNKIGLLGLGMQIGGRLIFQAGRKCVPNPPKKDDQPVQVYGPLCFSGLDVKGDMDLSGGVYDSMDLTGAQVGGTMILASERGQARWRPVPKSRSLAGLDLGGTRLSTLQSCFRGLEPASADWPSSRRLSGARIERIAAMDCAPGTVSGDRLDTAQAGVTRVRDFLDSGTSLEGVAPYRVFEKIYRNAGFDRQANTLAFAAESRITREADLWEKPVRWVRLFFGGYGLDPIFPSCVALIFVILGTVVLYASSDAEKFFDNYSFIPYKTRQVLFFDYIVCSLDRLIPVFTLSKAHQELSFDNEPLVRYYFFLHGLVGWLLTSMVVLFLGEILGLKI